MRKVRMHANEKKKKVEENEWEFSSTRSYFALIFSFVMSMALSGQIATQR